MQTTMNDHARVITHPAWLSPAQATRGILLVAFILRYLYAASLAAIAWVAVSRALGGSSLAYMVVGVSILCITALIQAFTCLTNSGPGA